MVEIDAAISKHKVAAMFGLPHKDEYIAKTGNDPDELLKIYKDWYDGSIRGMDAEIGGIGTVAVARGSVATGAALFVHDFSGRNRVGVGRGRIGDAGEQAPSPRVVAPFLSDPALDHARNQSARAQAHTSN